MTDAFCFLVVCYNKDAAVSPAELARGLIGAYNERPHGDGKVPPYLVKARIRMRSALAGVHCDQREVRVQHSASPAQLSSQITGRRMSRYRYVLRKEKNVCAMSCGGVHVTHAQVPHMWPHPLPSCTTPGQLQLVHTLEDSPRHMRLGPGSHHELAIANLAGQSLQLAFLSLSEGR